MLVGATLGVLVNSTLSRRGTATELVEVSVPRPGAQKDAEAGKLLVFDTTTRTKIIWQPPGQEPKKYFIDPTFSSSDEDQQRAQKLQAEGFIIYRSLDKLEEHDPQTFRVFLNHGAASGRWLGEGAQAFGNLFLRMLKMVSIPLVIFSLLTGVLGLGSAERMGSMFGQTLLYYVSTSLLAICAGLLMVNLIQPGAKTEVATAETGIYAGEDQATEPQSLGEVLFDQVENMIPTNPAGAAANGDFLSIIAFTMAFGIFTILAGRATLQVIQQIAEAGFRVMMKMTMAIIYLAPFGVLFLMFYATATQGLSVFVSLGFYMLTVLAALGTHAIIVLPLILWLIARRNPWIFAKAMSPALLTAFSSASSNATLPLTLSSVEQRAGVSNKISSFVLPLGATVNMDGTALYEVVAVLFIAQFSGLDLGLAEQIIIAFTALLASIGAAGIPHAGLVMMAIILQAVGLPLETQGLILAVDRILDMCRTSVNVWSDSCGCAVIAHLQGPDAETTAQDLGVADLTSQRSGSPESSQALNASEQSSSPQPISTQPTSPQLTVTEGLNDLSEPSDERGGPHSPASAQDSPEAEPTKSAPAN